MLSAKFGDTDFKQKDESTEMISEADDGCL